MASRNEFVPACYVVGWPSESVVKVGSSFRARRPKAFTVLGAEQLLLARFETYAEALAAEQRLRSHFRDSFAPAFSSKEAGAALLGTVSGWMECFAIDRSRWDLPGWAAIVAPSLSDRSSDEKGIAQAIASGSHNIASDRGRDRGRGQNLKTGWSPNPKRPVSDAREATSPSRSARATFGLGQAALFELPEAAYRRRSCPVCGGAWNTRTPTAGGVLTYAIQRQQWVKIGKTTDLEQRLRDLRRLTRPGGGVMVTIPAGMDHRAPLVVVNTWLGDYEHPLHLRYADHHAAGEWFTTDRALRRELVA